MTLSTEATYYNEEKWKNGIFVIELPPEILGVEINNVTIDNTNVKISSYETFEENGKQYRIYEKTLKKAGVHILRNEHEHAILKGNSICFWGLELPIEYYHKPRSPKLKKEVMEKLISWHITPNTEKHIMNGVQI